MNRRSGSRRLPGINPLGRQAHRRARNDEHENNANRRGLNQENGGNNDNRLNNDDNNHEVFDNLLSRWSKNRKIDRANIKSPKKPYIFRPYIQQLIPLHNDSSLTPIPRSGHRIVVSEDYIYCFGGFNSAVRCSNVQPDVFRQTHPLFQELWRFSKVTKTWKHMPCTGNVPRTLVSAALILLDSNHLLAFGGSGHPFGQHNSNNIHICDLRNNSWASLMVFVDPDENENGVTSKPLPGYGQAVVFDRENRILYVCGGTDGGNYNRDVHQLDISSRKWTPLSGTASPELGRYRHEMALYKGSLYLIAGGTTLVNLPTNEIDKFDLLTRSWSRIRTLPHVISRVEKRFPTGRISHACVQIDNLVYMIGGRSSSQDFKDIWSLNLDTFQWTLHTKMELPKATSFLAADCTIDGQLSIFGGVYNSLIPERAKRLNSVHEIWIKIPTLKRIAFEAVVDIYSQSEDYRKHSEPIKYLRDKFQQENIEHIFPLPKN